MTFTCLCDMVKDMIMSEGFIQKRSIYGVLGFRRAQSAEQSVASWGKIPYIVEGDIENVC